MNLETHNGGYMVTKLYEHTNDQDQISCEEAPIISWFDGSKEWYKHGKRHRTDGPAIEYVDGSNEWWVDGNRII